LASFQYTTSDTDKIARFLEQATFGPKLNDISSFPASFAQWIQAQQALPMTSHRRIFRERLNHRFTGPNLQGIPTSACAAGTRYRKYAFSDKDQGLAVEIKTDSLNQRKIFLIAGQRRTVVSAVTLNAGLPANGKLFVDGS
jgi:hypothetical protein